MAAKLLDREAKVKVGVVTVGMSWELATLVRDKLKEGRVWVLKRRDAAGYNLIVSPEDMDLGQAVWV